MTMNTRRDPQPMFPQRFAKTFAPAHAGLAGRGFKIVASARTQPFGSKMYLSWSWSKAAAGAYGNFTSRDEAEQDALDYARAQVRCAPMYDDQRAAALAALV